MPAVTQAAVAGGHPGGGSEHQFRRLALAHSDVVPLLVTRPLSTPQLRALAPDLLAGYDAAAELDQALALLLDTLQPDDTPAGSTTATDIPA